jgi:2-polyprenyl-6-hydroxyphenyl methylase/3-demethylubiquinone-9 3-methyltransferase
VWWLIKYLYNRLPRMLKPIYAYGVWYSIIGLNILKYTLMLRPMVAIRPLLNAKPRRGMSQKHDILDWMGGFPFEYARYDVLVDYMKARGFILLRGIPNNGIGCHELVLGRTLGPKEIPPNE